MNARNREKYGATSEYISQKLAEQNGLCAICSLELGSAFYADHNHRFTTPRGLLCIKCNAGIGMLGDSALTCKAAAAYLEKYSGQ